MTQAIATYSPVIPLTKTQPWPHQERAYQFAAGRNATMLALDMGLGKSATCTWLIHNLHWSPVLILCPKSVLTVWPGEFAKHGVQPTRIVCLNEGTVKDRYAQLTQELALAPIKQLPLVVVLNYEAAIRSPLKEQLLAVQWDAVILDESHKIKRVGGTISWFCKSLRSRATNRICLTGTPMPHTPEDIYAQARFLDPSFFGSTFTGFLARHIHRGGFKNREYRGLQRPDEFHQTLHSFMFHVKTEDVLDLPETLDVQRTCQLAPATMKQYRRLKEEFVMELDQGLVTAGNALVRLLRLQQLTSGYVKTDSNVETGQEGSLLQLDKAKITLLGDVLEDLAPDEPVVIFCRFHHDLDGLHALAKTLKRGSLELSGRVNQLAEWQAGEQPLLGIQLQSGGVGIDLTRARYCVYFSLDFSLANYLQSRKRLHRPGQHRNVTYVHLLAEHTVDEKVYQALERRQDVIESILKGGL